MKDLESAQSGIEPRILNPTTSEASYKAKQRSYRKTKQILFFLKFFYAEKQCSRQFWNAIEREPVRLESSILARAKRATNRNNVATQKCGGGEFSGNRFRKLPVKVKIT